MSQEACHAALKEQTKTLLEGPLKHIRGAALAAALLPLASIAAAPAAAQDVCPSNSAGTCVGGFVWTDANNNGLQDTGETGVDGVKVFLCDALPCDLTMAPSTETDMNGFYFFYVPNGTYTIVLEIPRETQPAPKDVGGIGGDDTVDSDGRSDQLGHSFATVTINGNADTTTDFGFVTSGVLNPGTGTPGYWKNHPEAWPADGIKVGGVYYEQDKAIALLSKVGKDKTLTMFSSLVSAMLNVLIGNDSSCVASTIAAANAWLVSNPVGSGVAGSSAAWAVGEPLHKQMDAYNNGLICAPHRN